MLGLGGIEETWRQLFEAYPDRFFLGVDFLTHGMLSRAREIGEYYRRILTRLTPATNALTLLYHLWNQETPTLFDPMAVAMLIDPTLCETETMLIGVDKEGFTRLEAGMASNAVVGLHTDAKRFMDFYLGRVAP